MKGTRLLLAIPAAVVSAVYVASPAFAEYRCSEPAFRYERIACQEAKKGPDDLRRFVARTQLMYNLRFSDYMSQSDLDRYYDRMRVAGHDQPERQASKDSEIASKE